MPRQNQCIKYLMPWHVLPPTRSIYQFQYLLPNNQCTINPMMRSGIFMILLQLKRVITRIVLHVYMVPTDIMYLFRLLYNGAYDTFCKLRDVCHVGNVDRLTIYQPLYGVKYVVKCQHVELGS